MQATQDGDHVRIRWLSVGKVIQQTSEGRGRQGDTGARKVIEWVSKAWTTFELNLPVFYRESLARLLALEKHRNLIETNITAGITLYTDHKSGLYENSLSNKGQLLGDYSRQRICSLSSKTYMGRGAKCC